ncbi:MAG: type II toxin-antitoxin system RelE/ParE family toxin [Betaproteobacteria bacterium]|nr:type II toxin-antitoxin system RelE/ParE family toxin [Betaproteobacteria bacterium]
MPRRPSARRVADYSVVFARSASKELRSLDSAVALRILKRIEALSANPRPAGVVKLEGAQDLWRLRVGEWRIVYRVVDSQSLVDIVGIRHRREAYR